MGNPMAGAYIGSSLGNLAADAVEGDSSMPNTTQFIESPSTYMPLAMPQLTSKGLLTPEAKTTIGAPFGEGQGAGRAAAIKTAERAQQARALQYLLMGQTGGGGGGGMSPLMMMMMQKKGGL
jgi:hypothetical protein